MLLTPILYDIHGLPVGGGDVRNSSNSFSLRWCVFSSEVEKLKWFCFDFALKLALYTYKKQTNQKSSYNTVCVKAKSRWQVSLVSFRKLVS